MKYLADRLVAMSADRWLIRAPAASERLRLFCFSHAGGNAVGFGPWRAEMNSSIEICAVQLPGRGARQLEAPHTSLPELIRELVPVIAREADLPFAFYGHSLGGLICFELARALQRLELATPIHMIISGCAAPGKRSRDYDPSTMDDDDLIAFLSKLNGTPSIFLRNPQLIRAALPVLRADFTLACRYEYMPSAPLHMPITLLSGTSDPYCTADLIHGWEHETTASSAVHWFDGDHFFIHRHRTAVIKLVGTALESL